MESSAVLVDFKKFQEELDARNDKYERIVKKGRDATTQSKRAIFLLHRGLDEHSRAKTLQEAEEKFKDIKEMFKGIAEELQNEDWHRFKRAYSPGLQEFIEAYSFWYFLKHKTLVSFEDTCRELVLTVANEGAEKELAFVVQPSEYMLGIADLTGELMRLCINSVGKGNFGAAQEICQLLRKIHDAFLMFGKRDRGLFKKFDVMASSLKKVEGTCYNIHIRGSEVPKTMLGSLVASNPAPTETVM